MVAPKEPKLTDEVIRQRARELDEKEQVLEEIESRMRRRGKQGKRKTESREEEDEENKPGLFSRMNAKLREWVDVAPVPMGVLTTIGSIELKDRAIDPLVGWTVGGVKRLTRGLTRGAAESTRANLADEAERNLIGGANLRTVGRVFAGETGKETGKNALGGLLGGAGRTVGRVFR